jgi:hypothetical protein
MGYSDFQKAKALEWVRLEHNWDNAEKVALDSK